jgi:molecular chaperone DnaK
VGYSLGIDLGTTYSAAATVDGGKAEVFTLGTVAPAIPSVVVLREDGEVLVGEAADRRSIVEPTRTGREFKRRLGDPAPLVLGGTPYGAEALMARLLRYIVDEVSKRQGGPPTGIVITHPANFGPYKKDLMLEMARLADVGEVQFLTEPEAAAINYSRQNRLEPGEVVAVYDFGGGTFDAAVLRRVGDGFEVLGQPEGMERLGGIDFDQAIMAHVDDAVGGQISEADVSDPIVRGALARLRADVRSAKESLSSDTDVTIPVMLPSLQTEVRLTRPEFEAMIRPRLLETVSALERAVRSAGIQMSDVSKILLVGGSSRIPLVAEVIQQATGRPVAVDAHPKFAIALGAAAAGAAKLAHEEPAVAAPTAAAAAPATEVRPEETAAVPPVPVAPPPPPPPLAASSHRDEPRRRGGVPLIAVGLLALLLVGGGVAAFMLLGNQGGGGTAGTDASATAGASTSAAGQPASAGTSAGTALLTPAPNDNVWGARGAEFRGRDGERVVYDCPPGGSPGSVWGTDVYTDDSSVCTAAVHAGAITVEDGGRVTIEIRPGETAYEGSSRNGIDSADWGSWHGSFVVVTDQ